MTRQTDTLQLILNSVASAQNYELEAKTTRAYEIIRELDELNEEDGDTETANFALFAAWIEWLTDWDNYSRNLLHRRRLIGILNKGLGEKKYSLQIYPYLTRLYSIGPEGGITSIRLHECLDYMTESEARQFASMIVSKKTSGPRQLVRECMDSHPECGQLIAHFSANHTHRVPKNDTKGRYYDLEEVFRKCNERNFRGKMPRPKILHWSARVNHSTMGSYNQKEDSLMVNRGLDKAAVPSYVLDFIMYHELLHKALGIKNSGGRRMAHTAEFRKYEQAHPDYERAEAYLKKNASKL